MRAWRVVGIAALILSPFTYTGIRATLADIRQISRQSYDCTESKYCMFWRSDWGGERSRYSIPLREREQRIWDGVLRTARTKNFLFADPHPFRTDAEADGFQQSGERTIYGSTMPSGRITLSSRHLDRMDDGEVCVLQAHELGHHIDNQTERLGHPFLYRHRGLDPEMLADEFAREICGSAAVTAWKSKWQARPWWSYLD